MPHHHFFPAAKSDVPPVVPADADESRPEPAPRSKPPTVTPKPPHQATKPQLGPRSSGPLSPSSPTSPRPSSSYVTGRWWNRDATDQTSSVSERQQRDNRDLLLHTTHSVNSYSLCVNMKWKWCYWSLSVRWLSWGSCSNQRTTSCSSPEEGAVRAGEREHLQQPCSTPVSTGRLVSPYIHKQAFIVTVWCWCCFDKG